MYLPTKNIELDQEEREHFKTICHNVYKDIVADAYMYAEDIIVPQSILIDNFSIEKVLDSKFGDMVYHIFYKVYISSEDTFEKVPLTWYDHLKHSIVTKYPRLNNWFKISYREIKITSKTLFPDVLVNKNHILIQQSQPYSLSSYLDKRDDEGSVRLFDKS